MNDHQLSITHSTDHAWHKYLIARPPIVDLHSGIAACGQISDSANVRVSDVTGLGEFRRAIPCRLPRPPRIRTGSPIDACLRGSSRHNKLLAVTRWVQPMTVSHTGHGRPRSSGPLLKRPDSAWTTQTPRIDRIPPIRAITNRASPRPKRQNEILRIWSARYLCTRIGPASSSWA